MQLFVKEFLLPAINKNVLRILSIRENKFENWSYCICSTTKHVIFPSFYVK